MTIQEIAGAEAPCLPSTRQGLDLPRYAERLLAFHRAHAPELRAIVRSLPMEEGERVLDVACGDGTFATLMAERGAEAVGLDLHPGFLNLASETAGARGVSLELTEADARSLPYADGVFDGAFCAQSFYSLPNVPRVLGEMRRVVRPGGWVAAMENDSLHHIILPWPPELEIRLRLAEHQTLAEETPHEERYYMGRRLGSALERAGLAHVTERAFATHRQAPLSKDERTFLQGYLDELLERALKHLAPTDRAAVLKLASPSSSGYMLDDPSFSVTYLDMVATARVPHLPTLRRGSDPLEWPWFAARTEFRADCDTNGLGRPG